MDQNWDKAEGPTGGSCMMAVIEVILISVLLVVIGVIGARVWVSVVM